MTVSTREADAAFADVICADQQWVDAESDALISASFSEPPAPPPPAFPAPHAQPAPGITKRLQRDHATPSRNRPSGPGPPRTLLAKPRTRDLGQTCAVVPRSGRLVPHRHVAPLRRPAQHGRVVAFAWSLWAGVSLTQALGFSRTISAFSAVANSVQPA
jgi:hypothetical protein